MRTSELKKLLMENKDQRVCIYLVGCSFNNVNINSVSDEMVKASYCNEETDCKQLYIQLDSIIAVEKI